MATFKLDRDDVHLHVDVSPNQSIINCLVQALVTAMPVALDAFFKCITNAPPSDDNYKPGDRPRCD